MLLQAPRFTEQSMVDPAGPKAQLVHDFWLFLVAVSAVVVLLVVGALLYGALRRRHRIEVETEASHRTTTRWVTVSVGVTFVILAVFLVLNFRLGRAIAAPPEGTPLEIAVIGHQWWWEVEYPDTLDPSRRIATANEIHIPTGRPVVLKLTSRDVIHSFWVPNLTGKKDLIPGYTAETWLQADAPGVYRGQCAEFCGHQHAKMAMEIVAHPPAEYERWAAQQRTPAAAPADSLHAAGEQAFMTGSCALCHTIAGTRAGGRVGPDLTHLASRRTIAAGSLPNTRGHLAGWILDPQRIKPGAYMPANGLEPAQLDALLAYLTSLR